MAYLGIASDEWVAKALCGDSDSDIWISSEKEDQDEAKEICLGCPVMLQCLDWAIRNSESGGIWGSMGPTERREYKRQLRRRA